MQTAKQSVVHVVASTAGGVGRHVQQLAQIFQDDAHFCFRVVGPQSLANSFGPAIPYKVLDISDRVSLSDLGRIRKLRKMLEKQQIVHAHGLRAGAMVGLATLLSSARARPKIVVTLHNLPVGGVKTRVISSILQRIVARRSDAVLGVSQDLIRQMRGLGVKKTSRALVPAPVPVLSELGADAAALFAKEKFTFLTVARLAPQKGLDQLLAAAEELTKRNCDFQWIVAGDGPLRQELERLRTQKGLPVYFLGSRTDVSALQSHSDVVVSTATWEGQPLSLQEALRHGKPIVATDAGGTQEVTRQAAILVPVGDVAGLTKALQEVFESPELIAELAEKSRDAANYLPDEEQVKKSLHKLYSELTMN